MTTIDWENRDIVEEQKTLALQKIQEALIGFSLTTKKEILDELGVKTSAEIEAEEEAKYDALHPTWFDDAPQSAKQKRKELVKKEDTEKMQWMHDNVSYNGDHTMNIIKLNVTFCEDISWTGQNYNWEEAKALAESKWYTLPSDYNNKDSQKIGRPSDWYKIINLFSNGRWDAVQGMELFRDMAWCNNRYWTWTQYIDNDNCYGGVARFRLLRKDYCCRSWTETNSNCRVCGLKNMNIAA